MFVRDVLYLLLGFLNTVSFGWMYSLVFVV